MVESENPKQGDEGGSSNKERSQNDANNWERPPLPEDRLWCIEDLGYFLVRSRRSISSDLARGKIPCVRPPSRGPRFIPEDIHLWLKWGCPTAKEFEERRRRSS